MKKFVIIVCTSLFFVQLFSQTAPVIKNLVFEGAGIRGIAYCGAIHELENRQLLKNVERVAGTSAGAVTALALSLGYSGTEIEELIRTTNFKKFNDGNFFFVGGINRVTKYFGWYRKNRVDKWLGKIIEKKAGNANITFAQLHEKGFKDLYTSGTCLNKQQLVIFSHQSYPLMKIRDAVRISMSIPLYFEAVFLDSLGNVISNPKHKKGLDVMVDGGFIGNFPIHIFDSLKTNPATLGFRIDSDDQIKNDKTDNTLAAMPIGNLKEYVNAFYNMIIENLNRQQLTKEDWQRTISISDGNIEPRIRKLSKKEVETLINNGRAAVINYLSEKQN
jgi:NTE family protein